MRTLINASRRQPHLQQQTTFTCNRFLPRINSSPKQLYSTSKFTSAPSNNDSKAEQVPTLKDKIIEAIRTKKELVENMILSGKHVAPNQLFTILFTSHKMKQTFRDRVFSHNITVSLNYVDTERHLRVRNLFCKNMNDIFLENFSIVDMVQQAAHTTTPEKPVMMLSRVDRWLVLNLMRTKICEHLSPEGYFLRDLPLPYKSENYVFGLTNEGGVDVKKMRCVIVKEALLIDILRQKYGPIDIKRNPSNLVNNEDNDPNCTNTPPQFETSYSASRWKTVIQMAKLYNAQRHSMIDAGEADLMRFEVCLPVYDSLQHLEF